jgi:hypothetical protein
MAQWPTMVRIGAEDLKLLVTSAQGNDQIKARLPLRPPHPRALLTLLEGVVLFSGEPLYVVPSAGSHRDDWLGCEAWARICGPPRVRSFTSTSRSPPRVRRTLRGVGDFRGVRRHLRLVRSR